MVRSMILAWFERKMLLDFLFFLNSFYSKDSKLVELLGFFE